MLRLFRAHTAPAAAAALAACFAPASFASPLFSIGSGQDLTLGGASHPRSVQVVGNNPAGAVTSDLKGVWFGLATVSVGAEVGDVDDLVDDFEALEQRLDNENLSQSQAEELKRDFDAFLVRLGDEGYVKLFTAAQPPFMPMGFSLPGIGGVVSLNTTAYVGARVNILDAPVEVQPTGTGDFEVTTRTSAYGKAAGGGAASIGYGGGVFHRPDGALYVGGRANYYVVELAKAVVALEDEDDSGQDSEAQDDVQDELDETRKRTSAVGLDVGALWVGQNFRAGGTVRNLNEPEFEYPVIGQDCANPNKSSAAQRNCFTAASFSNEIALAETYTMSMQSQVEAAVFTTGRSLFLSATYDLNSAFDAVGDEYQWAAVSAGYAPGGLGWLAPALRVGYRSNLADEGLDFASVGFSFFRVLNLDVSASTQMIENDGDKVPRSFMVSLGLELYFLGSEQ